MCHLYKITEMTKTDTTYRNVCFTLNNYTEQDILNISMVPLDKIQYLIYGKEIAPTTGTPHLQGYIELKRSQRLSYIKKILNNKFVHIENRFGTQKQAITYCQKDHDYTELGILKRNTDPVTKKIGKQGHRSDISNIWDSVKSGYSKSQLIETYPMEYAKYGKAIAEYYTLNEPARSRDIQPKIIWHYGPTGTNKTRSVYEQENDQVFIPKNYKWWDGYDRHQIVLLDDLRADYCKFHELLTLLDRYQYKVEVKGGMRQLVATKIYITSPYHPNDLFKNKTEEDIKQLTRRITTIIHFPYINVEDYDDRIKTQSDILHTNDLLDTVDNTSDTDTIDTDTFSWEPQHKYKTI